MLRPTRQFCSMELTTYPRPRTDHRLDLEWVYVGVKQGIDGELNQLTILSGNHIHIEVKFEMINWELN